MNVKALAYLSIAAKAGLIKSGEFQTETAVKNHTAKLVIIAEDASEGTKKKFINLAEYYKVPYLIILDKKNLGLRIGKEERSSAAITDGKLAKTFMDKIKD